MALVEPSLTVIIIDDTVGSDLWKAQVEQTEIVGEDKFLRYINRAHGKSLKKDVEIMFFSPTISSLNLEEGKKHQKVILLIRKWPF